MNEMLEGIKAVIFDMDGTLVDSMWMWEAIDREYLGRFGVTMPDNLQDEIEGISFSQVAVYFKEQFHIEDSLEKIKKDWILMAWEKYEKEVPLKDGGREFLAFCSRYGIQLGIATSNSSELTRLILRSHEIESYFSCVKTSCEVPNGKPAPDIYLLAAKELGVRPKDCLVFEDVASGILAGKRAGMKVCAVYDDFSSRDDARKKELADYYIKSFREIL